MTLHRFRDYYEVLDVPRTATIEDIQRAYRRRARRHHPDLQLAAERPHAARLFNLISEAHEVLGDPRRRARYDALPSPPCLGDGDDREMDLPLWPWQVVLGAEVTVETPEGAFRLAVPAGTRSGQRFALDGHGYAVARIVAPDPNAAAYEAFEVLKRDAPARPHRPIAG
jgi:DnaJ-class molecular chaperone